MLLQIEARKRAVRGLLRILATLSGLFAILMSTGSNITSSDELLIAVKLRGKWGFINKVGNEVVPCMYDYVESFSDGLANVRKDGKYGFIDKAGNEVVPCMYDYVESFSDGLARVQKDGKYGFIDKAGNEVITCVYEEVKE